MQSRQRPGRKSGDAASTYRDLREIFTEEQLKTEASRCLGCGATVVDPNKCIGCDFVQQSANLMLYIFQETC